MPQCSTRTRQKYDTFVIYLYMLGKEHLLPPDFRALIPSSTASSWRNEKTRMEQYRGSEFQHINKGFEWAEVFIKHQRLEKAVRTLKRVWISVAPIILPILNKKKEYEEKIINAVQTLTVSLPKEIALKIAGLSASAFRYRLDKVQLACGISPLNLCFRKHPLQLSRVEIEKMKELLTDSRFLCWPVSSIYHFARRNSLIFASLSAWYKYSKLLGLKRFFRNPETKQEGLKASRPNQFLHLDTTYWTLPDGSKRAIAFVSDSFSKMILGFSVGKKNGGANIVKALKMAVETIRTYHPGLVSTILITDGGSENHAILVEELIAKTFYPTITKVIARKDIFSSNSAIEAINKIAKRYLRTYDPSNDSSLLNIVQYTVNDYSRIRPHHGLKGLIPLESYTLASPKLDFSVEIAKAKEIRIEQNQKANCEIC